MIYRNCTALNASLYLILYLLLNYQVVAAKKTDFRSIQLLNAVTIDAIDDVLLTDEDQQVSFNVLANDVGDSITLESIWVVSSGAFLFYNPDGNINYKPNNNYFGADTLRYIISNPAAEKDTAFVIIQINPVNDVPVSQPDYVATNEDATIQVFPLENDIDIDQSGLQIFETTIPKNGVLSFGSGSLLYWPDENYFGGDTIVYKAREIAAGNDVVSDTIFIDILPVNDRPVGGVDSMSGLEEDTIKVSPLINDFDIDSDIDSLSLVIDQLPLSGTAWFDTLTWELHYVSDTDFYGEDSLFYTIKDEQGAQSHAVRVLIDIANVNDTPVANTDIITINNTDTLVYNPLLNDIDVDSSGIRVVSVLYPDLGAVAWTNDSITYSPDRFIEGIDTLIYYIIDGDGDIDSAMFYVTILQANLPPVAINDTINVNALDTILVDVLANDSDDQTVLTVADVRWLIWPQFGEIVVSIADDEIVFIPDTTFFYNDSAYYEISDELDSIGNGWVYFVDRDSVLDNDDDGIVNIIETKSDFDADGLANYLDADADNDSISDKVEGVADLDNDGFSNYLDLDSDGDAISDAEEGVTDYR